MLNYVITALFAFAAVLSVAEIAHSLADARAAYARLMREGEVLRAGLALQATAIEVSLRPKSLAAPRRAVATRRPAGLHPHLLHPHLLQSPLQACAA
jgi:hypothetical protein